MKSVAIVQSNYLPWKGYFDLIAAVDEFILYDDMQFTVRDWRNRNRIKTPRGVEWITVPVGADRGRRIRDVVLTVGQWQEKHWKTLEGNYRRAPCFAEIAGLLEPVYRQRRYSHLSALNRELIETVCGYLRIPTTIKNSWDYRLAEGKSERLADLCEQAGATKYVSGPAARGYLDEKVFAERGIVLAWFDYENYPEYPQLWGEFEHGVTILDLLFNCGGNSAQFMKCVR
jgi:hypothetical protein